MKRRTFIHSLAGLGVAQALQGRGDDTMAAPERDPVRVGIVGCAEGTHGKVWAEILASPGGAAFGMTPARVWDADQRVAEAVAKATGAVCVSTPEGAGEGVDGVLITELMPTRYLELSRPFLRAGMRVFYNRPFAGGMDDAREIVRLAVEHDARIYSASALFHTHAAEEAKSRLAELGPLRLFTMTGASDHLGFYLPHAIAALVSALGTGVESVRAVSLTPRADAPWQAEGPVVVYVQYAEQSPIGSVRGVVQMIGPSASWYAFVLKVFGADADAEEVRFEVSYDLLLHTMAGFFRTGEEPIAHDVMLEKTAVYYAALMSAREGGRRVALREV